MHPCSSRRCASDNGPRRGFGKRRRDGQRCGRWRWRFHERHGHRLATDRRTGSPDVLARLGALAPVHAVRGNVDHGVWSANLPVTQRIEIDGFRIYVLHILAELHELVPTANVIVLLVNPTNALTEANTTNLQAA